MEETVDDSYYSILLWDEHASLSHQGSLTLYPESETVSPSVVSDSL